jgi:hypothetical protein
MGTFLVGYDLNKSGQDYGELIDTLKGFGTYWHHLDSTWIIESDLSHTEIRDLLKAHIDANDELLVVNITDDAAAWAGFNAKGSKWLKDHL